MLEQRPKRFFYGWMIVVVVFLTGAFNGGIGLWGIGIFSPPMEVEFGWSRTAVFAALSIRSLVGGATAPIIGPWLDTKRGPRTLALTGAVVLGISLMALRFIDNLWEFYLLYGVLGSLAMMSSGQNMAQVLVPKWFVRRRGRALAFATMGTPLAAILFPLPLQAIVTAVGWRDAWFVLGLAALLILVPAALMIRTRPEDVGLLPDGDYAGALDERQSPRPNPRIATAESFSRREAMQTRSFWLILLAISVVGLSMQGFQANWLPYFQEIGFTATVGAAAIGVYGIFSALARIVWGLLAERYPTRNLMVVQTATTAAIMVLLLNVGNIPVLFVYAVLQGLTLGGQFILQPLMVANYFGRDHIGAIRGTMRPFLTLSGAVGPLMIAALYDARGSYVLPFSVVIAVWALAGFIYLVAVPAVGRSRSVRATASH